ncbi:MAG: serine/threonine protein kinase [Chloroflexi bacterium]|nr:serine/threonine protein kinase [Chloroflexota bacterium]
MSQQPDRVTGRDRLLGGRYRLTERLDQGGAGEIWRARDERLDRDVAVKLLGAGADEAFRERFTDEARRAASVSHANVVAVYDEGQDGADAYIVMEYIHGRTLRELIAERGPLPPHEAARIVAQVASALDAAHGSGVIHCDVKPANVIVDDNGTAKLTDFGIARAARDPRERELMGTARYIAPERIAGEPATARSDIYGLGLIAYELLSGQQVHPGLDTDEILRLRLDEAPPTLRAVRIGIAPEVDAAVTKALARDPDKRYVSAGAFADALLGAAEPGDATMPLAAASAVRPLPRPKRRGPSIDSVIALLAVLLVLLLVGALFANATTSPSTASARPPASGSPAVATTPNVVGHKLDRAVKELLAAGFAGVAWDVATGPGAPCDVARQDPAPGAPVARGQRAMVFYVPGQNCARSDR